MMKGGWKSFLDLSSLTQQTFLLSLSFPPPIFQTLFVVLGSVLHR